MSNSKTLQDWHKEDRELWGVPDDYGEAHALIRSAGSHQFSRDDLKAFAGSACISIYDDFDAAEITQEPKSVQLAWSYGRMLKVRTTSEQS